MIEASGSSPDPNQVFFDTVGGFKKGEVYGLGKDGSALYYEKRSRRHTASANSPLVSAQLGEMSDRLEASERARKEMEEKQKHQDEYLRQMKAQMDAIMRWFGGPSSFPGDPHDRTNGSGGAGAFVSL